MRLIEGMEVAQEPWRSERVVSGSSGRKSSKYQVDFCTVPVPGNRVVDFEATLGDYKGSLGSVIPEEVLEALPSGHPWHASQRVPDMSPSNPAGKVGVSPQTPRWETSTVLLPQASGEYNRSAVSSCETRLKTACQDDSLPPGEEAVVPVHQEVGGPAAALCHQAVKGISGRAEWSGYDGHVDLTHAPTELKQHSGDVCEPHYPGEQNESSGGSSKPPISSPLDAGANCVPHHDPEELSESSGDRHVCPQATGVPHHGPKELRESMGDRHVCGRQEWSVLCPREATNELPRLAKLVSVEVGEKRSVRERAPPCTLPVTSTGGLEDELERALQSLQEENFDFEMGSEASPGSVKQSRITSSGSYGLGPNSNPGQSVPESNVSSTKCQISSETKRDDKGGLERSSPQQVSQHTKEESRDSSGVRELKRSVRFDVGVHKAENAISIQNVVEEKVPKPVLVAAEQCVTRRTLFPPLPIRSPTSVTLIGDLSKVTPSWVKAVQTTQESAQPNTGDPVSLCKPSEGVISPKNAQQSHLNPIGSFGVSPASEISPKSAQQSHLNPIGSFGVSPVSEISPKSAQQSHLNPIGSFGVSPVSEISLKSAQPSHLNPSGSFGLDAPTLPVPNATNAASPSEMTGSVVRSPMHLPGWVQRLTENELGDHASTRLFPIPDSRETGVGDACVWESKHAVVDSMPALLQRDECNLTNAGQYNEPLGFCLNLLKVDDGIRVAGITQGSRHTEYYQIHSDEESDGSDQQQSAYDYLGDFDDLGCAHLSVSLRSLWPSLPVVQGVPLMLVRRECLGSLQARCWSLGRSFAEMPIGMTMSSCLLTLTSGPAPPRLLSAPSRPSMNVFLPIALRSGYQVCNVPGQVGARWGESLYPEQNKNQKIAVSGEKEQSPDTNLKDGRVVVQARLGKGNVDLGAKGNQRLTDPEVASEIPSAQPKEQVQDETSTSFVGPKPAWRSGVSCDASAPMADVKTDGQCSGAQAGKEGMNQSVCLPPGNQDNETQGGQVKDIRPQARDRCVQSRMHVHSAVCVRKGAYKIRAGAACFRPGQKGAVCQSTGIHPAAQASGVQSRKHVHRAVGATCQLGAYEVQARPEQAGTIALPGTDKVQAGSLRSVLDQAGTAPHLCANESQAGSLSPLPNQADLAPHPQAGLLGALSNQTCGLTQVRADKVQVSSLSTVLGQTGARQVQAGPSCSAPDPKGATCQSGAHQVQAGPSCSAPDPKGATCQSGANQVQAGPSCSAPDPKGATRQIGAHQVQAGPSSFVPDPADATCQSTDHQVQKGPFCARTNKSGATACTGANKVQAGSLRSLPGQTGVAGSKGTNKIQAGSVHPMPVPLWTVSETGGVMRVDPLNDNVGAPRSNLNALLGCGKICQSVVSMLGGGQPWVQDCALASIVTLFRISKGVQECKKINCTRPPRRSGNTTEWLSQGVNTLVAEMGSKEPDSNLGSTNTAAKPELVEPETVLSPAALGLHSHESGQVPVSFTPPQEQPALIPHDHPLKLAIMITAASTLENVCVLRLRLVQTGLPEYIWQKYSGGHFKIQHNQFHEQAEVGVGNWVLSQAAAQLQPRIVSVYQDTEQLGAFIEAVIVDLRDGGKYPGPGKEVIRENLFKMLKHIHRMNTIAGQVRSLYGCFDWKLSGEEYDYTLSSLLPPRSFFEAPESNKPEDNDRWLLLEDGVPFVQAQPVPTDQLQPVMQEPSEQAVSPAQVASPPGEAPGVFVISDELPHEKARERPFNDLRLRAWSCLFNSKSFEQAVEQQALLSCCTYFGSVHSTQQPPTFVPDPSRGPGSAPEASSTEEPVRAGWGSCPHYRKGYCRYGNACRYEHVPRTASKPFTPVQDQEARRHHDSQLKTHGVVPTSWGVCPHLFIKRGFCRYGKDCRYEHDIETFDGHKPVDDSVEDKGVATNSWGVCPHFQKGFCKYSDQCRYQHVPVERGNEHVSSCERSEKVGIKKVQVCPHYARGYCKRGSQCGFSHEAQPSSEEPAAQTACTKRSLHKPLSLATRQRLYDVGLLDVCFESVLGTCSHSVCKYSHRTLKPWEIRFLKNLLDEPADVLSPSGQQGTEPNPSVWQNIKPQADDLATIIQQQAEEVVPLKSRLEASRPTPCFRRRRKLQVLGSTILRRKLGDYGTSNQQVVVLWMASRVSMPDPAMDPC